MKFLVTWELHEGKLHDTLSHFARMSPGQEEALMGDKVKLVHRWHDLVRGAGAAIFESDDAVALSEYCLKWNAHMDFDLAVVVDDEEARGIAHAMEEGG